MYETYQRLGVHVYASHMTVIRAVRRKLKPSVRMRPEFKALRRKLYCDMIAHHTQERALVRYWGLA